MRARRLKNVVWAGVAAFGLTLAGSAATAENVSYRFEWEGAGGYSMRGGMSFDAGFLGRSEVRAQDLSCFFIEGRRDGAPVGRWALSMLDEETSWVLTFRPRELAFAVWGPDQPMPQAWNMDGAGTDCGEGGFGFNIGNAAQDLCIDGRLVVLSQVAPDRSFPVTRDDAMTFPADACMGPMLMSGLSGQAGWNLNAKDDPRVQRHLQ